MLKPRYGRVSREPVDEMRYILCAAPVRWAAPYAGSGGIGRGEDRFASENWGLYRGARSSNL